MRIFFTITFLLVCNLVWAQRPSNTPREDVTISGKILEVGTNYPLEYATVSFTNKKGEVVTGGITNEQGIYNIEVPGGVYDVKFEFISYKTEVLKGQRLFENTTLKNMSLDLDSEGLDEVVVIAETTEVQVRLDKKIYNIGKDLTTSGATISDALNNVPSVNVDVEGAISLRGNENVRILINGKPSAIAGFGSTDALQQLPAEAIERVEVITSPSARYDAEGTAGILNIILRKEKTLGFNGSVRVNLGAPVNNGINVNANLRTDKFNIFNTTGYQYRDAPGNAFFDNTFFDRVLTDSNGQDSIVSPSFARTIEDRDINRLRRGFNTNLGMEYFLTETSSITASGFLRLGNNETETMNFTESFQPINTRVFERTRIELEDEEDTTFQFALNYVNNFNKDGHKLTADFQYENDSEVETSDITERNTFPAPEELPSEFIVSDEAATEYLAQIDYVLPIGESAQFEAGYRGDFEETTTIFELLEQQVAGGEFIRNDSLSNTFTFNENIHALYTQYGNKFGKFSFLLGLRLENTQLKGEVEAENIEDSGNDDFELSFDRNFLGLFPTVNLIYEIGERENITLGYNRRINRPRGRFINPFPSRSSETNVFQGNPNLIPAFSNAFDLGYLKRWKKLTLTSSIYFQKETNSFERVQEDTGQLTSNGEQIIRTIPINLSSNNRYGFEAGVLYTAAKWLRLNGSFNYFNFVSEGSFNGVDYGTENSSWFARGSAKVTLPYKIDWQTNAFYRGPRNNAQTVNEGIFSLNLAFSKDIMKDNGTIAFNVSDLLNSRKRQSITDTDTFRSESEFQWRVRQFTVSFTYRFNEKKKRSRPDRGGGGDDEFEG